jgi:hypothetical protein
VRLVAGEPEQLELEGEPERLERRARRPGRRFECTGELEESQQRCERALVRLLLGEEAQHRFGAAERHPQPMRILARLSMRPDQVDGRDRLQLTAALMQLEVDV